MKKLRCTSAVILVFAALGGATLLQARNYPAAKALASQLTPMGLTPKGDPGGLGRVGGQIGRILSTMQTSAATGGPSARDLVNQAYDMFRPDVGPAHRTAAVATLTAMWDEARALGAFDDNHQYTGKITRGPERGGQLAFEYIVPMTVAPAFSRDVVNVRLVSPSKKREEGTPLDARAQAYVNTLKAIEREVSGMKSLDRIEDGKPSNSLGQTKEEEAKLFKEAMQKAGEAALELPKVSVNVRMLGTPANRTEYRWRLGAEVTNISQHPTEVEVECIIIGTTDKYRENYIMGEHRKKLQLRAVQVTDLEFFTPLNEGSYKGRGDDYEQLDKKERARSRAFYRGAIIRVHHAKGVAATAATDPSLLTMLEAEALMKAMPRLYMDPKTWPKRQTTPQPKNDDTK